MNYCRICLENLPDDDVLVCGQPSCVAEATRRRSKGAKLGIDDIPLEPRPPRKPEAEADDVVSPWEGGTPTEKELRWHYCMAAGELGERSAWSSLVFMAQVGGHTGQQIEQFCGEASAPAPPPSRMAAAARDSAITAALRKLPQGEQAVLEVRFSERRPDVQLRGLLGAEHGKLEPVVAYLVATGKVKLKMDGTGSELTEAVKMAETVLARAIADYEQARSRGTFKIERALTRKTQPRQDGIGVRKQAGLKGASARRLGLVEAPRRGKAS